MAQFTLYRSTDVGAPVLTGEVGKLTALLYACLVTGYGVKTGAGWTRDFNGVNKSVFRGGAGTRLYLRVQDDVAVTTAKEARLTGYETMTDVDTGTGPFPTAAQGVGAANAYLMCRKSTTADATARAWILFADNRTFYLFVLTGDIANKYMSITFGDFYSFKTGDAYNCLLIGRQIENSAAVNYENLPLTTDIATALYGHSMARGHTQLGGSIQFGKHGDLAKSENNGLFAGSIPFTNPEDGAIYLSQLWIHDITTLPIKGIRGRLRGLWYALHPAPASLPDGTTFSGVATGELNGKTFTCITDLWNGSSGTAVIETSNTLETN